MHTRGDTETRLLESLNKKCLYVSTLVLFMYKYGIKTKSYTMYIRYEHFKGQPL